MWTRWIDLKYVERMTEACIVRNGPIRDVYTKYNYKTILPPECSEMCVQIAHEKLDWFNTEMNGREYVCGDRFTLADIHLFVFLRFFEKIGLNYPRELRWIDDHFRRIGARPSSTA
jgi:glutathione S-transferase